MYGTLLATMMPRQQVRDNICSLCILSLPDLYTNLLLVTFICLLQHTYSMLLLMLPNTVDSRHCEIKKTPYSLSSICRLRMLSLILIVRSYTVYRIKVKNGRVLVICLNLARCDVDDAGSTQQSSVQMSTSSTRLFITAGKVAYTIKLDYPDAPSLIQIVFPFHANQSIYQVSYCSPKKPSRRLAGV